MKGIICFNKRRRHAAIADYLRQTSPSNHFKLWTHLGFYETDDGDTLDKECAILEKATTAASLGIC